MQRRDGADLGHRAVVEVVEPSGQLEGRGPRRRAGRAAPRCGRRAGRRGRACPGSPSAPGAVPTPPATMARVTVRTAPLTASASSWKTPDRLRGALDEMLDRVAGRRRRAAPLGPARRGVPRRSTTSRGSWFGAQDAILAGALPVVQGRVGGLDEAGAIVGVARQPGDADGDRDRIRLRGGQRRRRRRGLARPRAPASATLAPGRIRRTRRRRSGRHGRSSARPRRSRRPPGAGARRRPDGRSGRCRP